MDKILQRGRTMVETLSVLAIIGVLSVTGLHGFKMAMQKHKDNELLNEINKCAYSVASQLFLGSSASLNEFANKSFDGVSISPEVLTWDNEFGIQISNVSKQTCQNLFLSFGKNSIVRWIAKEGGRTNMQASACAQTNNLVIGYNKNMEKSNDSAFKTDFADKQSCENARKSWCPKPSSDPDIPSTTGLCYDSQCMKCQDSGNITAAGMDGIACTYQGMQSKCQGGVCLDPEAVSKEGDSCETNADCGSVGSGYYCRYSTFCRKDSNCWKTVDVSGGGDGKCTKVGSKNFATTQSLGYVARSFDKMNWWSAYNWCQAQGMRLFDFNRLYCYNAGEMNQKNSVYYCYSDSNQNSMSAELWELKQIWAGSAQDHWTDYTYVEDGAQARVITLATNSATFIRKSLDLNYKALCQPK